MFLSCRHGLTGQDALQYIDILQCIFIHVVGYTSVDATELAFQYSSVQFSSVHFVRSLIAEAGQQYAACVPGTLRVLPELHRQGQ